VREFHVYILASRSRVLYIGVTSDLMSRVLQHRMGQVEFTAKYLVRRLVYVETTQDAYAAIRREKQLKGWLRRKKVALIEATNPEWHDLAADWFED
jgi:putative endonuclease